MSAEIGEKIAIKAKAANIAAKIIGTHFSDLVSSTYRLLLSLDFKNVHSVSNIAFTLQFKLVFRNKAHTGKNRVNISYLYIRFSLKSFFTHTENSVYDRLLLLYHISHEKCYKEIMMHTYTKSGESFVRDC